MLSFWRGNLANVYRYFPSQAINFAFKGRYSDYFASIAACGDELTSYERKMRRTIVSLASGGLAGATALFVSYPFDVARTRLAVDLKAPTASSTQSTITTVAAVGPATAGGSDLSNCSSSNSSNSGKNNGNRTYRGTFHCIHSTYQQEGIRGVYSGFGVSLAGVVVFRALYLGGYDIVKDHYELEHASRTTRFIAAQVLTTVVGTLCFPIDTVKRRLMVQGQPTGAEHATSTTSSAGSSGAVNNSATTDTRSSGSSSGSAGSGGEASRSPPATASASSGPRPARVPYRGGWDAFRRILAEEGIRGLYAGLSVNLVRGFSGAVLLVAYDDLRKWM